MKKIAIIAGVFIISSSLFSCGGSSSCVSSEKYIPTYFSQIDDFHLITELSDVAELETE